MGTKRQDVDVVYTQKDAIVKFLVNQGMCVYTCCSV